MEGTPKAIEPKGIVRNATKIGVQDGQAEDLINLRFMDGSWRASGNGRQIENMPTGTIYEQLYVHTNIYHHLLGVDNGTLYWFAEIADDGVTFYPLDGTTDRSLWPEDKQDLPTEPVVITTVVGNIWITQTGHLLTVIDESDDFEYFVFKTGDNQYIEFNTNVNGKPTDRSLYPFGQVHFNLYEPVSDSEDEYWHMKRIKHEDSAQMTIHRVHDDMISMFAEATEKNQFTKPFLVVVACRLYDGSHAFASQPILVFPRDFTYMGKNAKSSIYRINGTSVDLDSIITEVNNSDIQFGYIYNEKHIPILPRLSTDNDERTGIGQTSNYPIPDNVHLPGTGSGFVVVNYNADSHPNHVFESNSIPPVFSSGQLNYHRSGSTHDLADWSDWITCVVGSDLIISLENYDFIDNDIISALDVFITEPVDIFESSEDAYKKSPQYDKDKTDEENRYYAGENYKSKIIYKEDLIYGGVVSIANNAWSYIPKLRSNKEIIYDLLHSPFFLLKSYNKNELVLLKDNPVVDLTLPESKFILKNISEQKRLETESLLRTTYLPKICYNYNSRLHIANYKSYPFFGYPIDLFHLHNHSVKVQDGAWFPADADGQRVLPNLADNYDEYLQYTKDRVNIEENVDESMQQQMISINAPYFLIKVNINIGGNNKQTVCRWIPAYDTSTAPEYTANFIEALNPLLTYPDARAEKMEIYYFYFKTTDIEQREVWVYHRGTFKLKPHPYLNIAYYIDPDLKPISMWQAMTHPEVFTEPTEKDMKEFVKIQNAEEYFPNGLKVSKADQPMFFPVDNTYQVGSAEILALMSNTIAVGTGQTGDAPLYVFCKDGVYALYVDSSGQMAYPNARILARDVCNNPRSVTPIDAGVVFTTDRGLMMIAGEQVQEIGAPAEGDVVQFWNAGSVDYSKIATASMQQIAGLPSELCSTTDFLTYLQDKGTSGKAAIINYNHNMRELMVSNPNYPYSYVLDRDGNWSRRDYAAAQYVNNYPTSYRVDAEGHFYKVDDEGDANTSLEHRKEADNKIFYLSNVIKLDSIGFKQAYRFVVRGYFETQTGKNVACVVEGSYDGRKFQLLGRNRKSGKFRDIGCLVSHTDMRFFRVCLAGQVTGKTRIDYMEMSADGSVLNTKIR